MPCPRDIVDILDEQTPGIFNAPFRAAVMAAVSDVMHWDGTLPVSSANPHQTEVLRAVSKALRERMKP